MSYETPSLFLIFWFGLLAYYVTRIKVGVFRNKRTYKYCLAIIFFSLPFLYSSVKLSWLETIIDYRKTQVSSGTLDEYIPYNALFDVTIDGSEFRGNFDSLYCSIPRARYIVGEEFRVTYIDLRDHWFFQEFCFLSFDGPYEVGHPRQQIRGPKR